MDIINKAYWASKDGAINITLPFAKVDESRRTVSGFATMDNVDSHDDIVTAEASLKAFASFRGNVREMHQPIAVGKVVEFSPETYYDQKSDKFYSGVFVTARVSTGAQDTWEKVLDGTLSGFSIGGKVVDAELSWDDTLQKNIQIIKDMELFELSLVDNPANPLANVVSIQKASGSAQESIMEHVYTCTACKTVISSMADSRECPDCDTNMTDIGFIERRSTINKEIKKMVSDYEASITDEVVVENENPLPETDNTISEGDSNMDNEIQEPVAEETTEAVDEVSETETDVEETETVVAEVEAEAEVEADAGAEKDESEVVAVDPVQESFAEIAATLSDLKTFMDEVLATHAAQAKEAAQEATAAVAKSVDEQIKSLKEEFSASLDALKGTLGDVEKRIDTVEDSTAVKKSGDLGGESANIKKSVWDGTFLGISTLENE